jgi:hypothetical protein
MMCGLYFILMMLVLYNILFVCFSSVIASNLLLVDEIMRAGMSSLKG